MNNSISIMWWIVVVLATIISVKYLLSIKIDVSEKWYSGVRSFLLSLLIPAFMISVGVIVAWINKIEIIDYLLLQNTKEIRLILIVNLVFAYALFASILIVNVIRHLKNRIKGDRFIF